MALTQDKVIEQFKKIHGNKYNYSKVVYNKSNQKVEIICPKHGSFFQKPTNHKKGAGCPHCNYRKQKDTSWFINEAKKVTFKNDLVYNYDETE